jgi:hypothetical protein
VRQLKRRELLQLTLGSGASLILARTAVAAPFASRTSAVAAKFFRGTLTLGGGDEWAVGFSLMAARLGGFADDASLPFENAPGIVFSGQLKGGQAQLTLFDKEDGNRKTPIGTGVARVTGSKLSGTYSLNAGGGGEFKTKLVKPDKKQQKKMAGTWEGNFGVFDDLPVGGQLSISANGSWQAHDLFYFDAGNQVNLKQTPTGYVVFSKARRAQASELAGKAYEASFVGLSFLQCCFERNAPCCESETDRQKRLREKAAEHAKRFQTPQSANLQNQGSLIGTYDFGDPAGNRPAGGGEPVKAVISKHR